MPGKYFGPTVREIKDEMKLQNLNNSQTTTTSSEQQIDKNGGGTVIPPASVPNITEVFIPATLNYAYTIDSS